MKHRVKIHVPVEKRGIFGFKKTVMESRTIEVDGKTYRRIQKDLKNRPFTVEEMMLYDELFEDDSY